MSESDRSALVAIDGTAGMLLEREIRRHPRELRISCEARTALQQCQTELVHLRGTMSVDARRNFGRLEAVIDLVLADED